MAEDDPGVTRRLGGDADPAAGLAAGDVVGGWRVVQAIASGGFGTVYQAAHVRSGATGALKVLHPHLVTSPEIAGRMVREAEIIAGLHHPNVVGLLEAGLTEVGAPFLVMEFVRGVDLDTTIRGRGRYTPAEALAVLEPLCAAVAAAHAQGVIHRDLKAGNVLVCRDGAGDRVVLVDFGIAKLLEGAGAELTASRQALGTPASMAPEQIRGEVIDARTDVYALGALAYHLLTGRMVFADASVTMSQYLHLHAARPRPSEVAPLPAAVDDVIVRAMAVEPTRRFADPLALFAALRAAVMVEVEVATRAIVGAAVLVRADHDAATIDDALLDDLDAVFPLVEPIAVVAGFTLLRELGDAWLFVGEHLDAAAAAATVAQLERALATRPTRHPQVAIELRTRVGEALVRGAELIGGALADPGGW
ncbi:MAG: serine/threonine protein kinase [Myxococcales bacterium]|nr:serine/threonine protein kinase [Myxococcales bacterium]